MIKKGLILLFTIVVFVGINVVKQALCQPAEDLNIRHMPEGYIYAASGIEDTISPGGFGRSDNYPEKTGKHDFKDKKDLFLEIDTSQIVTFAGRFNGYRLYIGNKSDSLVRLNASDSRLYAVAEAYYEGRWQPIEYLPSSWCGNSYHYVYLRQNEYWKFTVPRFTGEIAVKLRYRLDTGYGQSVYSNEIPARINPGQLTRKEDREPSGIMDPYGD